MLDQNFTSHLKRAFGQLADNFREPEARCFLLRRAAFSAGFEVVLDLERDYHVSFEKDSFRNQILFQSFSNDEDFPDLFATATAIAWGIPDADGDLDLFMIDPSRQDQSRATGASPLNRCLADRVPNERFRIPNN